MKRNINNNKTLSYNLLGESVQENENVEIYVVDNQPFEIERTIKDGPNCFLHDLLKIFIKDNNLKYKE